MKNGNFVMKFPFIMTNDKCCCLICNATLTKKGNMERHFVDLDNK